jgi:molybdate transport system substrate-binding protein
MAGNLPIWPFGDIVGQTYRGQIMRWLGALFLLLLLPRVVHAEGLTVFAAASLTDSLRDVAATWEKQGYAPLRLSFGASSILARQIEQGAPANLFASADEQWMDYLASRNLIVADTRRDLLSNRLVLIVPAAQPRHVTIAPGFDLAAILGADGRLATGDPAHVPAGIYARQALEKLGLWTVVKPRLAPANDVRNAMLLVERGEAPAGIVYATDAAISRKVMVAGSFPENTHDRISYPFSVVRSGDTPEARALMQFLGSPEALAIFARRGFAVE